MYNDCNGVRMMMMMVNDNEHDDNNGVKWNDTSNIDDSNAF